jgi:hypothetical protein
MTAWDAVVDVSNVCWDEQLPPRGVRSPVWGRLGLVLMAWRRAHGEGTRFDLVADAALEHNLDDAREYCRLLAARDLVAVPHADMEILAIAREHRLHVLTRDRFLVHLSAHPWIVNHPERFHRWQYADGKVTIVPLGSQGSWQPTVPAAGTRPPGKRLDPADPRYGAVLRTRWACGSTRCPDGGQPLLLVPRVTSVGEPRCPACGGPLKDRGQRGQAREVIVAARASEAEILRLVLDVGTPVTVGLARAPGTLGLLAYADAEYHAQISQVSRRHATLRVEEPGPGRWRMVVTDLWSSTGTAVQHRSGAGPAGLGQPKPAEPGRDTPVMDGGRVILGNAVTLRFPP